MGPFFRIATHSFYIQVKTLAGFKNLFSTYTVYIPAKCLIFKLILKIWIWPVWIQKQVHTCILHNIQLWLVYKFQSSAVLVTRTWLNLFLPPSYQKEKLYSSQKQGEHVGGEKRSTETKTLKIEGPDLLTWVPLGSWSKATSPIVITQET